MGISLQQYRYAIANLHSVKANSGEHKAAHENFQCVHFNSKLFMLLYILIIFYISIYIISFTLSFSKSPRIMQMHHVNTRHVNMELISSLLILSFLEHINTLYTIIILKVITYSSLNRKAIRLFIESSLVSIKRFIEVSLLIYVTTINITLIVISNCSLLNPGPCANDNHNATHDKSNILTVFYQNVHGFITYSSLGSLSPDLNITKVLEFQAYVAGHKPDIILLNETWLKHTIHDSEIFPNNDYKIFRLDRSPETHPPDPDNHTKFRRNGGGILIAVNNCLDMKPKLLKSSSKAEILTVVLHLKNNKKIGITTCYRVGTLGERNLSEINKHFELISSTKSIISHTMIGDMNLDSVNWLENSSSIHLHREFLNVFANHNLSQLISSPTHYLGNTLDVVLSDVLSTICNIVIRDHNEFVRSDHFAITLDMKFKRLISRNKGRKRVIKNYKKANWREINSRFNNINWHECIDCMDINSAWNNFKEILNSVCNQHIPNITIQCKQNLPWFDSDIHKMCLKKERLRLKFKNTQNPEDYRRYSDMRKDIKLAMKSKMRSALCDSSNPNTLTKKFWSYVKNASNSTRIPDSICRNGIYTNEPSKQAELFNSYFYDQFSGISNYSTDVDFSNDILANFRFEENKIKDILLGIDTNKSSGPDEILGIV